jgi:hypothetical protein
MFFSRLSKLAFALFLISSVACEQATTASNQTSNTANVASTNPTSNTSTTTATPNPQNSTPSPNHKIIPYPSPSPGASTPTPDPNKKPLPIPMGPSTDPPATRIPTPEELPREKRVIQTPVDISDSSRRLVQYYRFLTDIKGLNLNRPLEMPGGPSLFKADDVIQFTFREPQAAVLVARYTSAEKQAFGIDAMRRFNVDGRRALQVRNYLLLVKWGDEKIFKALTDSIEQFENIK